MGIIAKLVTMITNVGTHKGERLYYNAVCNIKQLELRHCLCRYKLSENLFSGVIPMILCAPLELLHPELDEQDKMITTDCHC